MSSEASPDILQNCGANLFNPLGDKPTCMEAQFCNVGTWQIWFVLPCFGGYCKGVLCYFLQVSICCRWEATRKDNFPSSQSHIMIKSEQPEKGGLGTCPQLAKPCLGTCPPRTCSFFGLKANASTLSRHMRAN